MKHTKERIFDVALELFSRNGYDAVSVNEIAFAAGITNAAIYRHYESKQAILDGILVRFQEKLDSYLLKSDQVDKYLLTETPRQLLGRCVVRFTDEDMDFMTHAYRITYREHFNNQIASRVITAQLHEKTADSVRYVLDKLIEQGSIPTMNTQFMGMIWAQYMFSFAVVWITLYFDGPNEQVQQIAEGFTELGEKLIDMSISGKVPR